MLLARYMNTSEALNVILCAIDRFTSEAIKEVTKFCYNEARKIKIN